MKYILNMLFTVLLSASMLNAAHANHTDHNVGHSHHAVSMKQAVRQVLLKNPKTRILATKTVTRPNGKRVHVIKVVTPNGKVRRLRVKAN